jgi:hypothetical protein
MAKQIPARSRQHAVRLPVSCSSEAPTDFQRTASSIFLLEWRIKFRSRTTQVWLYLFVCGSRGSVVGIASGYGLDEWGIGIRVPVRSRIFSSPCRPDRSWGRPSLLYNGYRGLLPRVKAVGAWSWPHRVTHWVRVTLRMSAHAAGYCTRQLRAQCPRVSQGRINLGTVKYNGKLVVL